MGRRGIWGPKGAGPGGRPLCYCGCGREVPKGARTKFEFACWKKWSEENDPVAVRALVEERDKGVCALCSVDTVARAKEAREWRRLIEWLARRHFEDLLDAGELELYTGTTESQWTYFKSRLERGDKPSWSDACSYANQAVNEEMEKRFGPAVASDGHTWEADHIIPVIEGGANGPANMRTLCLGCHRGETAKLAARRAARRRAEKELSQPTLEL